ncbi:hypothetical protein ACFL5Q_04220 [Planctomycetota bacterium]
MSKLSSLKELIVLRSLLGPKLTVTRVALISAVLLVLFTFGRDGISYLSTAHRLTADKMRSNVPIEFEMERARTMINGLIPDIRNNMIVIAEEEVAVDSLRKEVASAEEGLLQQREKLLALRGDVDNVSGDLRIGSRPANREEVREELGRRFHRYQTSEATVAAKLLRLEAREKSLAAVRVKLETMLNAKRDMEVEVENLEARFKAYQSQSVATKVEFDDTQVARCKQLVDDLRIRLQVADRLLAADNGYDDLMTGYVSAPADIEQQIDQHFAAGSSDLAVATDARRQ